MLLKHFFFYKVAGGLTGYRTAGYIQECRVCVNPHGSRFFANSSEVKKHWDQYKQWRAI
jgi:hypothetical protein